MFLSATIANRGDMEVISHGMVVREVEVESLIAVYRTAPNAPLKPSHTSQSCCCIR
jgi:hypothetical protein